MRARSSIPALMCIMIATACDSSPSVTFDPGGAALLVVAPSGATLRDGGRLQLNLSAHDEHGQPAKPSNVVWTASNPSSASVDAEGVVTGHDVGASRITAWWNGTNGTSTISVIGDSSGRAECPAEGGRAELSLKEVCRPR